MSKPLSPEPSSSDDDRIELDLDSAIADLSGTIGTVAPKDDADELKLADDAPLTLVVEPAAVAAVAPPSSNASIGEEAVELSYARDGAARSAPGRTSTKDIIQGPTRSFWADAFYSFVYPFRSGNNTLTFLVVAGISLLRIPLLWVGCYGLAGVLIIYGWLCALYLSVVQETAVGSDDLPGIRMEEGFIEDIIKPMLKYLGAFATALAPAAVYTILMAFGVLPSWMVSGIALAGWMALGFFLVPVFILLFAFNALDMLYRLDLIITTVFRTLGAFMAIWLMLLIVGYSWTLPLIIAIVAQLGLNIRVPDLSDGGLFFKAALYVFNLYFTIVAMRLIGLYYLHFKRRFTLVFE